MEMDEPMMRSVLNVAPSVVSIITRSGDNPLSSGTGTIIRSVQADDGLYQSTILSSASLLVDTETNEIPGNIRVDVYHRDGYSFIGTIVAHDRHYNILFVSIKSETILAAANISRLEVDDPLYINANVSFGLRPHKRLNECIIRRDDNLAVIGRHHKSPYTLMADVGKFSFQRCNFDCNELLRLDCKTENGGIGGPVINKDGKVIGIAFCASFYTPFLPTNVALGWWNRHEENKGLLCQPELGVEIVNLHRADMEVIDKLSQNFPNVFKGVFVKKVKIGSLGHCIGLCEEDVIVKWCGNTVGSVLELFELAWGHVGESADLLVLRPSTGACLNLSVVLVERGGTPRNE